MDDNYSSSQASSQASSLLASSQDSQTSNNANNNNATNGEGARKSSAFVIPKKVHTELLFDANEHEVAEYKQSLSKWLLDATQSAKILGDASAYRLASLRFVNNGELEQKFRAKQQELTRRIALHPPYKGAKVLKRPYFYMETSAERVQSIVRDGFECTASVDPMHNMLGPSESGVHLCKHPDVALQYAYEQRRGGGGGRRHAASLYCIWTDVISSVFQQIKPDAVQNRDGLPCDEADLVISSDVATKEQPVARRYANSLVYKFEYNQETLDMETRLYSMKPVAVFHFQLAPPPALTVPLPLLPRPANTKKKPPTPLATPQQQPPLQQPPKKPPPPQPSHQQQQPQPQPQQPMEVVQVPSVAEMPESELPASSASEVAIESQEEEEEEEEEEVVVQEESEDEYDANDPSVLFRIVDDIYRETIDEVLKYSKPPRWRIVYEMTGRMDVKFRGAKQMGVKVDDVCASNLKFTDETKTTINVSNLTNKLLLQYQSKRLKAKTLPCFAHLHQQQQQQQQQNAVATTLAPNNTDTQLPQQQQQQQQPPQQSKKQLLDNRLGNKEKPSDKKQLSVSAGIKQQQQQQQQQPIKETKIKLEKIDAGDYQPANNKSANTKAAAAAAAVGGLSSEMTSLERRLLHATSNATKTTTAAAAAAKSSSTTIATLATSDKTRPTTGATNAKSTQQVKQEVTTATTTTSSTSTSGETAVKKATSTKEDLKKLLERCKAVRESSTALAESKSKNNNGLEAKALHTVTANNTKKLAATTTTIKKKKDFWSPDSDSEFSSSSSSSSSKQLNEPDDGITSGIVNDDIVIVSKLHLAVPYSIQFSKRYYDNNMSCMENAIRRWHLHSTTCCSHMQQQQQQQRLQLNYNQHYSFGSPCATSHMSPASMWAAEPSGVTTTCTKSPIGKQQHAAATKSATPTTTTTTSAANHGRPTAERFVHHIITKGVLGQPQFDVDALIHLRRHPTSSPSATAAASYCTEIHAAGFRCIERHHYQHTAKYLRRAAQSMINVDAPLANSQTQTTTGAAFPPASLVASLVQVPDPVNLLHLQQQQQQQQQANRSPPLDQAVANCNNNNNNNNNSLNRRISLNDYVLNKTKPKAPPPLAVDAIEQQQQQQQPSTAMVIKAEKVDAVELVAQPEPEPEPLARCGTKRSHSRHSRSPMERSSTQIKRSPSVPLQTFVTTSTASATTKASAIESSSSADLSRSSSAASSCSLTGASSSSDVKRKKMRCSTNSEDGEIADDDNTTTNTTTTTTTAASSQNNIDVDVDDDGIYDDHHHHDNNNRNKHDHHSMNNNTITDTIHDVEHECENTQSAGAGVAAASQGGDEATRSERVQFSSQPLPMSRKSLPTAASSSSSSQPPPSTTTTTTTTATTTPMTNNRINANNNTSKNPNTPLLSSAPQSLPTTPLSQRGTFNNNNYSHNNNRSLSNSNSNKSNKNDKSGGGGKYTMPFVSPAMAKNALPMVDGLLPLPVALQPFTPTMQQQKQRIQQQQQQQQQQPLLNLHAKSTASTPTMASNIASAYSSTSSSSLPSTPQPASSLPNKQSANNLQRYHHHTTNTDMYHHQHMQQQQQQHHPHHHLPTPTNNSNANINNMLMTPQQQHQHQHQHQQQSMANVAPFGADISPYAAHNIGKQMMMMSATPPAPTAAAAAAAAVAVAVGMQQGERTPIAGGYFNPYANIVGLDHPNPNAFVPQTRNFAGSAAPPINSNVALDRAPMQSQEFNPNKMTAAYTNFANVAPNQYHFNSNQHQQQQQQQHQQPYQNSPLPPRVPSSWNQYRAPNNNNNINNNSNNSMHANHQAKLSQNQIRLNMSNNDSNSQHQQQFNASSSINHHSNYANQYHMHNNNNANHHQHHQQQQQQQHRHHNSHQNNHGQQHHKHQHQQHQQHHQNRRNFMADEEDGEILE